MTPLTPLTPPSAGLLASVGGEGGGSFLARLDPGVSQVAVAATTRTSPPQANLLLSPASAARATAIARSNLVASELHAGGEGQMVLEAVSPGPSPSSGGSQGPVPPDLPANFLQVEPDAGGELPLDVANFVTDYSPKADLHKQVGVSIALLVEEAYLSG